MRWPRRAGVGPPGAPRASGGPWRPLVWVLVPAGAWVVLCLQLWSDGVPARAVLLPVRPADYYLLQALIVVPLLTVLCWVFVAVALRWSRMGEGSAASLRRELAQAYSLPLGAHLLAELGAYFAWGSQGLASVARWSAPLAFLTIWLWASRRLVLAGTGWGRAAVGVLVALVLQALLGSWALR